MRDNIYWIFVTNQNFLILSFSHIFMLKLNKPFRIQEICIISFIELFGFEVWELIFSCSFLLIFCPVDPHILRIRIQEAKISRIRLSIEFGSGKMILMI